MAGAKNLATWDTYTSLIRTIPSKINLISFASYAEPTIDPLFIERLEILRHNKLDYWNITNGTNLTEPILSYFLNNISLIRNFFLLDVPAVSPEAYRSIVGGSEGQLERLRDGLHRLGLQLRPKSIDATISVLGENDEAHNQNYNEVYAEFSRYGYKINKDKTSDRAGELRPFINQNFEHGAVSDCSDHHFNGILYFGVEGDIYTCCHDYRQRFSFGNIKKQPLIDILQSRRRQEMIAATKAQMCRRCVSRVRKKERH